MKIDLGVSSGADKKRGQKSKKSAIEVEEKPGTGKFSGLMDMLQRFGKAFFLFSQYSCQAAIDVLGTFPENHQISGWVQKLIARCYFERMKYLDAEIHFKKAF